MAGLRNLERKLEDLVSGAFARAFKGEVEPIELIAALKRDTDNGAKILSRDRRLVPNSYTVWLSDTDYARLASYGQSLTDEVTAELRDHARQQKYTFAGPVELQLEHDSRLAIGKFRTQAVNAGTPAARAADAAVGLAPQAPAYAEPAAQTPIAGGSTAHNYQPPQPPVAAPPRVPSAPVPSAPIPSTPGTGTPATMQLPTQDATAAPTQHMRQAPPQDRLVLTHDGRLRTLTPPGIVIGRSSDADLQITDPGVSRRHAEIRVRPGQAGNPSATILDLGSTNGTEVNGRRIQHGHEIPLAENDKITIGSTTMVFGRRPGAAPQQG